MPKQVTHENRLSTNHPGLPAYIDPELNDGLTADKVARSSNKSRNWTCYAAGHIFENPPTVMIRKRKDGSYPRCPECVTLAFHNPDIATEWHPTKNGTLTPDKVTYGSATKRWWICHNPECPVVGGYEWRDTVAHRTSGGRGCPACAGKLLTNRNRLSRHFPEIAAQWHPAKNGKLTPASVMYGSNKSVWWKCNSPECPEVGGYEWEEIVAGRTNPDRKKSKSAGCVACAGKIVTDRNRLIIHYPTVAEEWVKCLDCDRPAGQHSYASNHRAQWLCPECEYEWDVGIADRTISSKGKGTGCRACTGKVVTDRNRLTKHTKIAKMVLPELNKGKKALDIPESSNKKLNLKCDNGHVFRRSPNQMIKKQRDGSYKIIGCPDCNTVAFCYPELIPEWNYEKNEGKTPYDFKKHSPASVWWICSKCKHGWRAQIASRTQQRTGCPACAGKVVTDKNRLTIHHSTVAGEWVACLKCVKPVSEHSFGSNHRARWRCNQMHEWEAVISSRTHPADCRTRTAGNGCSKCHSHRSMPEIRIACELAYVFPGISPSDSVRLDKTDRRRLNCDIFIPTYNLVVEYDGFRYHPEDRVDSDIEKTRELEDLGYKVLRIREAGLELLPDIHNIRCSIDNYYADTRVKAIVDDVLRYIAREFDISNADTKAYLDREGLANAELAETIIANNYERQLHLQI